VHGPVSASRARALRSPGGFATRLGLAALLAAGAAPVAAEPIFRAAYMSCATGRSPFAVATSDFNGDGNPDLVVANQIGNSVSMLLGAGDGTIAGGWNYPAGNEPVGIAVGRLDADDRPDVVVANPAPARSRSCSDGAGACSPTRFPTSPGTRRSRWRSPS
jgi:hypothetical protein